MKRSKVAKGEGKTEAVALRTIFLLTAQEDEQASKQKGELRRKSSSNRILQESA